MCKLKCQKYLAFLLFALFMASLTLSGCGSSKAAMTEPANEWTLVNPEGVVKPYVVKLNPHPSALEGKTIALRWNGKENGNNFLDVVATMLQEQIKDVKVIKLYEIMPESIGYSPAAVTPERVAKIKALKPDLIISAQAD